MKKLKTVVVGYGNRGQVYADYSLDCPEQLEVIGIVDPNPFKHSEAKERYGIKDEMLFFNLDDFLAAKIDCDFVINSTMDALHYETAMKILGAGYDMLMEKPIVPNEKELLAIRDKAKEMGCNVFVGHVLRYTPFYRTIKQYINDGKLGDIMTMEMNEHVCTPHFLAAFDRGKWNSEAACGSGFLLAKCCHDMDIMCWLNNSTVPEKLASMGSRSHFIKPKMPKDATEFCYQCPHVDTCVYSAKRQYLHFGVMPFLVWDKLNKPLDEITQEEKEEFLRHDNYGRCAYIAGGDLVDRQNVIVSFKDGSCCSFTLVGGTVAPERYIHIVGTQGEIEGKISEDKFVYRTYTTDQFNGSSEVVDVSKEVVNNAKFGGHSGGDFAIMHDLCAYLNGDKSSISITSINDSVNGHLCVFAAEKARKENRLVALAEFE